MDADNQDEKPFSFWLARHSGIQMNPNAMRILRAPVSREARGGEPPSRLHGPIACGIRGVSVQVRFADQEMHYGAPYLLMCRGDLHAAEGTTSIPSRSTGTMSGRRHLAPRTTAGIRPALAHQCPHSDDAYVRFDARRNVRAWHEEGAGGGGDVAVYRDISFERRLAGSSTSK
jgi:hypothetical protein